MIVNTKKADKFENEPMGSWTELAISPIQPSGKSIQGSYMKQGSFKIERKRLADQIIEKLAAMIAVGDLKPGEKLPSEPELMKSFGVGRSSVREAIGALSLVGLITVRHGDGTYVTETSEESQTKPIGLMLAVGRNKIRELIEARIIIEKATVQLAAELATDEEIDEIIHQHNLLKPPIHNGKKSIQADISFHIAIAKASHNSVLIRFLSELRQPMKHWMEQKAKHDWGYEMVYDQHNDIVEAIKSGDADRAQSSMRNHLESTGEKLVAAILEIQSDSLN